MDFTAYARVVVVRDSRVEELTLKGWKLLQTVAEDILQAAYDQVVNPHSPAPQPNNYGGNTYTSLPTVGVTTNHCLRVNYYIMGLPEEVLISEQEQLISNLQEQLTQMKEASKAANHAFEEAKKTWDEQAKSYKTQERAFEGLQKKASELEAQVVRLRESEQTLRNESTLRLSQLREVERAIGLIAYQKIMSGHMPETPVVLAEPEVVTDPPELDSRADRFDRINGVS